MTKDTATHLEELYEHYRPQMDGVITADQILLKIKSKPDSALDFDQHFLLLQDIVAEIKKVWDTYRKYNILVESKVNNAFDWIFDFMPKELALLTIKLLLDFLPLENNISRISRKDDFHVYYKLIKAAT